MELPSDDTDPSHDGPVRSRILAGTLAAMVAVAMVAAVVIAQAGDPDEATMNSLPRATAPTGRVPSPERAPTSPSNPAPFTTGTAAPTPPTTAPASTTTARPSSEESGYNSVPKPGAGERTVVPGGAFTKYLTADIATAFGFSPAEVEMALAAVQLPPEAGGNPEGWLAPGQYEPAGGASAREVVQAMVDRRVQELARRARFRREQWYRVLTAASVIEKETYNQNEKPKVARVLTNRLADGGPLQMDSIILYPVSEDRIFTTRAERESDQPYNSYRHDGLPPTPICSPDEASIDAFLAPPPGDWWFYVTIDLSSGETRYSVTYEEHQANVELLRAWLREHPTD